MKDKTFILGSCLLVIISIAGMLIWVDFNKEGLYDSNFDLVSSNNSYNLTGLYDIDYELIADLDNNYVIISNNTKVYNKYYQVMECKVK